MDRRSVSVLGIARAIALVLTALTPAITALVPLVHGAPSAPPATVVSK